MCVLFFWHPFIIWKFVSLLVLFHCLIKIIITISGVMISSDFSFFRTRHFTRWCRVKYVYWFLDSYFKNQSKLIHIYSKKKIYSFFFYIFLNDNVVLLIFHCVNRLIDFIIIFFKNSYTQTVVFKFWQIVVSNIILISWRWQTFRTKYNMYSIFVFYFNTYNN